MDPMELKLETVVRCLRWVQGTLSCLTSPDGLSLTPRISEKKTTEVVCVLPQCWGVLDRESIGVCWPAVGAVLVACRPVRNTDSKGKKL